MEKDLYSSFSKFISLNWANRPTSVFELKRTKLPRLNKNSVAPHQIRALKMSSYPSGCYHKISDMSLGAKPFDSFIIKNAKGYLVICFDRRAYFIDIHTWCDFVEDKCSVTEEECDKISELTTNL